jgi:RimJ/RimL family protein N-acetyltransferase
VSDSLADWRSWTAGRLTLAPLQLGDAAALRALTDDPSIAGAIDFLPLPFTQADAEALIRGIGARDCFLGVRHAALLIGVVGAHLAGDDRVEIGYWIGRDWRGQGFATEASGAVIAQLRRDFPARRIIAECRPDNAASWRVLEKLDFRATGTAGARPGRRQLAL